jgi:ribosomal protein L16 Arg81 hydroxylase
MPVANFQFEELLAPGSPEEFFRDAWEKKPLLIPRGNAAHYEGLLSLADVDQIIAFTRPEFCDPSAFQTAAPRRPTFVRGSLNRLLEGRADGPGLAELRQVFDRGTSVVIMAMQHRWPAVARLCRNLESVFHCPVHANLYLTPAGAQGFAAHYDPHEVFVLQLEGTKTWRVYDRAERLPLPSQDGSSPASPLGSAREMTLAAGDLLYLPRGHVHEAYTAQSYSLHLTVGVNVYRWADLLHHFVDAISRQDERLRESISGGALPAITPELSQRFLELTGSLASSAAVELFVEALHLLGDQFFRQLQMLPGTQFDCPRGLDEISLETVLENAAAGLCRVVHGEAGAAIEFPGNRVGGPHRIASTLEFVAHATRFAVRDLPGDLNPQAKVVLARRLVREGLLTIAPPTSPVDKIVSSAQKEAAEDGARARPSADESAWETLKLEQLVQSGELPIET